MVLLGILVDAPMLLMAGAICADIGTNALRQLQKGRRRQRGKQAGQNKQQQGAVVIAEEGEANDKDDDEEEEEEVRV